MHEFYSQLYQNYFYQQQLKHLLEYQLVQLYFHREFFLPLHILWMECKFIAPPLNFLSHQYVLNPTWYFLYFNHPYSLLIIRFFTLIIISIRQIYLIQFKVFCIYLQYSPLLSSYQLVFLFSHVAYPICEFFQMDSPPLLQQYNGLNLSHILVHYYAIQLFH